MPTTRKPANKAKTTTTTRVKDPGTVQRRKDAKALEARVTELEKLIDLLSLRVAIAESTAQSALYRITQVQSRDTEHILGI